MAHRLCMRLDGEPVIFRGCTTSELGVLMLGAVLFWLPMGFVIAWSLGIFGMGMGLAAVGVFVTVVVTASVFQRIKRDRPEGYYLQYAAVVLHRQGLRQAPFLLRSGLWDLGRTH